MRSAGAAGTLEVTLEKLLIVEDDAGLREQLRWALKDEFAVLEADSAAAAHSCAETEKPALVCLDMGLDGRSDAGLDIIDALIAGDRACKIVAITGSRDEGMGREAIRRGAFDYLGKPLEIGDLTAALRRALRLRSLESEAWGGAPAEAPVPLMIGESEAMTKIFEALRRLAATDVSVLITGESGTGKELCARALHLMGRRRNQPFVPINCGAIPDGLLESELFGYSKGAFTGAAADKPGLIESAHRGTLFLDEIGDMAPGLQVKLLRFLQDQRVQRVGDTRAHPVDVRIIAATNKNSHNGSEPSLRTDLYYRLSQCEVDLPPLRERGRDALVIAHGVVDSNRARFHQPRLRLSSRAEKAILAYGWPGNVRELENRLNRAAINCKGQVIEDVDLELGESLSGGLSYREARRRFERNFILDALRRTKGNISLAARTLGVTRPTFYDLMKKNGIEIRMEPRM
jgi:two-component system NtrC family response regulator